MPEKMEVVSQAEFARRMNVSRAAVSHWKRDDILSERAFTKPDKTGKLYFEIASEDVRTRRDIGQALGNGIDTGSTGEQAEPVNPDPEPPAKPEIPKAETKVSNNQASDVEPERESQPRVVTVEDRIKAERLEGLARQNRMEAAKEAEMQGQLMATSQARAQMAQIAGLMMTVFEGSLVDLAGGIASEFKLESRDVLHVLKVEFRKVRELAAKKSRKQLKEVSASTEVEIGEG